MLLKFKTQLGLEGLFLTFEMEFYLHTINLPMLVILVVKLFRGI